MSQSVLVAQIHGAGISRTILLHKYLVRNDGVRNSRLLAYVDIGTLCHLKWTADSYYIVNKYPNKLGLNRFLLDNTKESESLDRDVITVNNELKLQYYVIVQDYKHTKSTMQTESSSNTITKNQAVINFPIADHELRCAICTELFIKAITLKCSHTFCLFCITKWKEARTGCPICRTEITVESPTTALDNFINIIFENASNEMKEHREIMIKEREEIFATKTAEEVINISDSESFIEEEEEEAETDYYESNTTDDNNSNTTEYENDS